MIFTREEKLAAVEREIKYRRQVYPRLVEREKYSQEFATRQIAIMEAIAEDYRDPDFAELEQ